MMSLPHGWLRAVSIAALGCAIVCGAAWAEDPNPATEAPEAEAPALSPDPAAQLRILAAHLDEHPSLVVVTVLNEAVTQSDLADVVRTMPANMGNLPSDQLYRRALDVMVRQKAMLALAKHEHLDQEPNVIREGRVAVERIVVDAWLKQQANAAVTEKALHDLYDREFANRPGPEEVQIRVILVPSDADARGLIQRIHAGGDFAELARQFSKDPTAANGGALGWLTRDATTPELAAVMFSMAPGEVTSYPVATLMGYFIIRCEGRRFRATLTFDEARPRLEQQVRADAVTAAIRALITDSKLQPAPAAPANQAKD